MADYVDAITAQAFTPREYLEHQLEMTEDEKKAREMFFEEQFKVFNEEGKQLQ